jgi:tetratricopeptide (TPR) repeat protein
MLGGGESEPLRWRWNRDSESLGLPRRARGGVRRERDSFSTRRDRRWRPTRLAVPRIATRFCAPALMVPVRIAVPRLVLLLAVVALAQLPAHGDHNADFLDALREAGWDDTAVAYLDWVEQSPLMTDEFAGQLAYERAASLAAQARRTRSRDERSALMKQAAESFREFAGQELEGPRALDALRQSANLLAELALDALDDADQATDRAEAAGEAARTAARGYFHQADEVAGQLLELCTERLAALPKPTVAQADPAVKAQRDELRARQADVQFLLARISFNRARAYEAKSPQWSAALEDANRRFAELVEQYRDSLVGKSSRFYQGRCAQEQGDYAKALGCYQDLVSPPPSDAEFRRWAARAHRRRAECLIAQDKVDEAIRDCEEWLAASRPEERSQPEWLEVSFRLADAYRMQLESEDGGGDANRVEAQVRSILRDVAAQPNEFQRDAQLALASLTQRSGGEVDFRTFADAFAAGKTALELMTSSQLAARLARENNPEAVAELEDEAAASKDEARRCFELAVELADRDVPLPELNATRYYLCWLYWDAGRTEDAAVLGELVARRYGESEFAPNCAAIALQAWEKLYREARAAGGDGAFASQKLAELAQVVATRWPHAPEAASAVSILINVALEENRIEQAEELLAKLPPESRAAAEMRLGTALWDQYIAMTSGRDAQFDEAANALRDKAATLLTSGFAALQASGEPTSQGAIGALYLVQVLLARGDAAGAIEVLEDVNVGPLTLVEAEAPVATRPDYIVETYKVALRSYLSAQPPRREEAQGMMAAIEEFATDQGGAVTEQLTRIYVRLGLQLQRQVKELTAAGNHEQAEQVAAAFGDVLTRVAARPDLDWSLRNWIAQTNLQLGQGLRGAEAQPYLQRAQKAFEAVLAAAAEGGADGPSADLILGVRKRLGDCLIALGEYKKGVDQYAEMLRERPSMLEVQQAAAAALQAWGVAEKRQAALDQAIRGARPDDEGKNLIWGWLRLAAAADSHKQRAAENSASDPAAAENIERLTEIFFDARYNIALARVQGAEFAEPASKLQQLRSAKKNIESMRTLYPDLGGPKWKAAFEALLKRIDDELKKLET